ncbi:MAG: TIGR04282 family arsenosugar biosynthesis glycosyltransferase [Chitinophagaceae bacterium]|nr:TIGR04282 family arsenosugar biosynthesis glycosyltransferase [Chitinophagaceae bacterium]
MYTRTIIVLAKTPELGKVKTRIAAKLGEEKALAIYTRLLHYTFCLLKRIHCRKVVYTSGDGPQTCWAALETKPQTNGDLGNRMASAFEQVLSERATKCIIIGTDCATLTEEIIETAFTELETKDLVIGPASDGGYYLLGMKKMYPALFKGISWSTEKVFEQTIVQVENLSLDYSLLPVLSDMDEAHQVPLDWY